MATIEAWNTKMTKQELIEFLKENLKVVTEVDTSEEYVGGLSDGASMYKTRHSLIIQLELEGEVISSATEYFN